MISRTHFGLVATDWFNRASLGSNWDTQSGTGGITTNRFTPSGSDARLRYNAISNRAEMVVIGKCFIANGAAGGVTSRHKSTGEFYYVQLQQGTTAFLFKYSGGSFTSIQSTSFNYTEGDRVFTKLHVKDDYQKAWLGDSGATTLSGTDTTITGTGTFGIRRDGAGVSGFDDFYVWETNSITMSGLSTGYKCRVGTKVATEVSGTATVDLDNLLPGDATAKIEVLNASDVVVDTFYPADSTTGVTGVVGGDTYTWDGNPEAAPNTGSALKDAVLASHPIALYDLGESSGPTLTDDSGHGLDATVSGSPTYGAASIITNESTTCIDFASDGHIVAPNLDLSLRSFAIEMWVKPSTITGNPHYLFDNMEADATNRRIHAFINTSGGVELRYYNDDLTSSGGVVAANGVYHVVLQYDAVTDQSDIYVNGGLAAQGTDGPMAVAAASTLFLLNSGGTDRFAGKAQYFAVYVGRTLTATEIGDHYTTGSNLTAPVRVTVDASYAFAQGLPRVTLDATYTWHGPNERRVTVDATYAWEGIAAPDNNLLVHLSLLRNLMAGGYLTWWGCGAGPTTGAYELLIMNWEDIEFYAGQGQNGGSDLLCPPWSAINSWKLACQRITDLDGNYSGGQVVLTWTNISNLTGFQVWRDTGSGFSLYADVNNTNATYTDTSPPASSTILYKIIPKRTRTRWIDSASETIYGTASNTKSITT